MPHESASVAGTGRTRTMVASYLVAIGQAEQASGHDANLVMGLPFPSTNWASGTTRVDSPTWPFGL
jgi:hypothetical protein